jgi:hypothetical protein
MEIAKLFDLTGKAAILNCCITYVNPKTKTGK